MIRYLFSFGTILALVNHAAFIPFCKSSPPWWYLKMRMTCYFLSRMPCVTLYGDLEKS